MSNKRKTCLLLLCFGVLLYGTYLGLIPLLDPDEPVYGETAKEMLLTGDWLSPRIYGEFWYDKPPLFYWLEAISFKLFGLSTWSARLPSVLATLITSIYLYCSSISLIGEKRARYGAFIFTSALEIIILARSAVTDATLMLSLTIALVSFLKKQYKTAYIACGLALLAKGPIGFAFPALIVALWMILSRKFTWKNIMSLHWTWGIPLACFIGLPWFIYMGIIHGAPFIDTFLGYHNITRFVAPEHAGKDHIWMYLVVLAAGFFPWVAAIPAILASIRKWMHKEVMLYLMVWAGFIFMFFSLSSTQLFSYILPMYPALSLLAGCAVADMEESGAVPLYVEISHAFFFLLVVAALGLAPIMPDGGPAVKIGILIMMTGLGTISVLALAKRRFFLFRTAQYLSAAALILSVWILFASSVSHSFTSYAIGNRLHRELPSGSSVYIDSFYRPSIAFYQNIYGHPLPEYSTDKQQNARTNASEGVYLPGDSTNLRIPSGSYILVQKKSFARWPEEQKKDLHLLWQEDTACFFIKGGNPIEVNEK